MYTHLKRVFKRTKKNFKKTRRRCTYCADIFSCLQTAIRMVWCGSRCYNLLVYRIGKSLFITSKDKKQLPCQWPQAAIALFYQICTRNNRKTNACRGRQYSYFLVRITTHILLMKLLLLNEAKQICKNEWKWDYATNKIPIIEKKN